MQKKWNQSVQSINSWINQICPLTSKLWSFNLLKKSYHTYRSIQCIIRNSRYYHIVRSVQTHQTQSDLYFWYAWLLIQLVVLKTEIYRKWDTTLSFTKCLFIFNSFSSIYLICNGYIYRLFSSPLHTKHNLRPDEIQDCITIKWLAFCFKMYWTFSSHYQYFDISECTVFILIYIGSYNIWQQQFLNKEQKSVVGHFFFTWLILFCVWFM